MRKGAELYYLHGDHPSASLRTSLGSTSLTTDANGGIVAQSRYLPYGQERWITGTLTTDFTFTGQRNDAYTHLIEMGARWYDPLLARWVSADTIVPQPGNPQSLNRYSYAYNNALRYVDPSGHGGPGDWLIALGNSGPAGKSLVVGMAEVAHKANQYRDDIFFPKANTTFAERLEASTVVGATAVAAGAIAVEVGKYAMWGAPGPLTEGLIRLWKAATSQDEATGPAEQPQFPVATPPASQGLPPDPSKSWGRLDTLEDHFDRHGADFGAKSADEYAQMASDFRQRAQQEGLPTKVDSKGVTRIYDPDTNTFGAYNPDGTTKTFFKPDPAVHGLPTNMDYWISQ